MRPYEIVIIFDADLEESAIRESVDRVAESIRAKGGNPGRADHWKKRRFAYELAGRTEGYYVILEVTCPPEAVSEANRMLSLADEVLRHKVIRVPETAAGRQRPAVKAETEPVLAEVAATD